MFLLDRTMGDIACSIPGATALFHRYKLDFCCGGGHTLATALHKRGLDPDLFVAELADLIQTDGQHQDWRDASRDRLIDHILARYHEVHRQQLPELIRLATRVEHVHGDREDCPVGLAALLTGMQDEMDSHMQKEEMVLFPLLRQHRHAAGPIQMMRFEHDQHGETLAELMRLTHDITPPVDACNTWRALYAGLKQFREDLMQHIHLENNVLFVSPAPVAA